MTIPPGRLLEGLRASRFMVLRAEASVGVGERQSPTKGVGLEFAEHRAYRRGDDIRHLDARLLARLGEPFIRLYSVDRQLPITIIVDGSASMRFGTPDKFSYAMSIAQTLGFVALKGGDQVRIGIARDGAVTWSPRLSGAMQLELLFDWARGQETGGAGSFGASLRTSLEGVRRRGLVFLLSDWWDSEADRTLDPFVETGSEIVALHIAAPEEIDAAALGDGPHLMIDAETGEEVEVMLDPPTLARYRAAFADWATALREGFKRREARYFRISSATDLERLFMRDLRAAGLIS
jgi:uncharacterized protein (DUF58 family)